jgi:hemerythrin
MHQVIEKIIWSKDFSVGNSTLDQQHFKIVSFINELIEKPTFKNQAEALDCITKMLAYSVEHLDYEEQLLNDYDYPDAKSHAIIHQFYVTKVKNFLKSSFHCDDNFKNEVLSFLKDWWIYHILEEDMKYRSFLEAKGVK